MASPILIARPGSDGSSASAKRRWAGTTSEQRCEALREVRKLRKYEPDPDKPRCACGAMTLKRAQARADTNGKGLGHRPGCTFYRAKRHPGGRI